MSDKEFVLIGRCQSKTRDYIKHLESQNTKANEEIERLANIIKKAKNCIKEESWFCYKDNEEVIDRTPVNKLLEILDKEKK